MMTYFNPKSCRGQAFAPTFSGKIDHLCRECFALICAPNPRNPIFYVGAKHSRRHFQEKSTIFAANALP
ncbi:hypothetical protein [Planktothricoides sp. SR001]|uniref:hypothetical protein n=1 Tax=Planktothricoides sp. SR001 TaxID=1705388 RepID=UPI0012E0D641|nr:hypothetical protein [Planktothricoides sp. SR001]